MNIFGIVTAFITDLWWRFKPLAPQYRSREAWLEYCRKTGRNPAGNR